MSFQKRQLAVKFLKDGEATGIELENYRVEAVVNSGGTDGMYSSVKLRIYGMDINIMRKFSTDKTGAILARKDMVYLSASNENGALEQIFQGNIIDAYIDYQAAPDVTFNVDARSAFFYQVTMCAPQSNEKVYDVADKAKALCSIMGLTFTNKNVKKTTDSYLCGSYLDQLRQLMYNTKTPHRIANGKFVMWNNGEPIDDISPQLSPGKGLIGYPQFIMAGFILRSVYNPEIEVGRRIVVSGSEVPEANGSLFVQTTQHELSTYVPNGPWFTTMRVTYYPFYVSN